ncbi:MAG: hypothetical protein H6626_14465 [Pseudobdellovibrionaceae bacterium]|nr:hypothetical protein [Bdellovibrionales bacterium]USN47370.1 MAG: hypothetical protein H6626_14465 [Pseudobdellovibrionaceae bacterium]
MKIGLYFLATLALTAFTWPTPSVNEIKTVSDIPVVQQGEHPEFSGMPEISMVFRSGSDKNALREKCQSWALATVNQVHEDKVFAVWCEYSADVVLREYVYKGQVIVKNW